MKEGLTRRQMEGMRCEWQDGELYCELEEGSIIVSGKGNGSVSRRQAGKPLRSMMVC